MLSMLAAAVLPPGDATRGSTDSARDRLLAAVRTATDGALGPLRITATARVLSAARAYAYAQFSVPPRADDPALVRLLDPADYTLLRRVDAAETSLQRVLAPPPELRSVLMFSEVLPPALLALAYAWSALSRRHVEPFDSRAVGLEYARCGLIVINWRRFRESRFWPASVNLDPVGMLYDLERQRGVRSALVPREGPGEERYLALCAETGLHEDAAGRPEECTIFDPLRLARRPHLFDGSWHYRRRARARMAAARQLAPHGERDVRRPHMARLHRFTFRPGDQLRCKVESMWFERDHEEIVYAITHGKELLFAPPRLLRRDMAAAAEELDVWQRTLDRLLLVEAFTPEGDVGNVQAKRRTEHYRQTHRARLEQAARQVIRGFISLDTLRRRDLRKVKHWLAAQHQHDPAGSGIGCRWYHDALMREAQHALPVTAVRRREEVCDRERWPVPQKVSFFTQRALRELAKAADGTAPYLHAWATFCLEAGARGLAFADTRGGAAPGQPWTPREDFELFRQLRRRPRMTEADWNQFLRALPGRCRRSCQSRADYVNRKLLAAVLGRSDARKCHTVGHMAGDEAATKRAIFVVGICQHRQRQRLKLHSRVAEVWKTVSLSDDEAQALPLPNTYAASVFGRIDPCNEDAIASPRRTRC